MQWGVVDAVVPVLPRVEHHQVGRCVRHVLKVVPEFDDGDGSSVSAGNLMYSQMLFTKYYKNTVVQDV